jgi:DNA-binding beta-propeller fold protein YncE
MKLRCILAFTLLFGAFALPSFPKDLLFVTTNWNEPGKEYVLVIDPESGQIRVLWAGGAELDAAVSPDVARLYVNYIDVGKGNGLAIVDIATGVILTKIETPQLIRWILPSHPAMMVSPDGRWLYLLKTNYDAGSYDYFLVTFDTREGRFLSGERAIASCPGARILPVPGDATALVLCGGRDAMGLSGEDHVLRLPHFAYGQLDPMGRTLYLAAYDGTIRAVDLVSHEIMQTSKDAPLRYRRIMPASDSMSPDGRLWYLPMKIPANGEQEIEQILVFDTHAMTMANVITPAGPFSGLALGSDGRLLYASQSDLQSIMVIDTESRRTIRTLAIGAKPSILFVAKTP